MSSALHPAHAHTNSKQQWWSRPSASKSSSIPPYRSSESLSGPATPTTPTSSTSQTYDDKPLRGKQSKKFNTLASVIGIGGFKSKKSHPTINIPSGPVSPPLPVQIPPPQSTNSSHSNSRDRDHPPPRPPRSARPVTVSSTSSYQYDPKSPGEPSIYTYPSSEEGVHEPMTPSDQLSRHRTSYQPSLFTFAEQQDHGVAALRLGDAAASRYSPSDARRISVLSDPSVIDPHMMKRERAIRSSRVSASSYYPSTQSEQKVFSGKLSVGYLQHRDSFEKRKSSADSLFSREIDLTSDTDTNTNAAQTKSPELRPRDLRHSDIPVPAVPKMSASMLLTAQRSSLPRSTASENNVATRRLSPGSRSASRTASPVSSTHGHNTAHDEERSGRERDRVRSLRNSGLPANDHSASVSRLSPSIRPKAASVSAGSLSGSSAGSRPSPSIVTSFSSATPLSRNASVTSGTTGSATGSMSSVIQRQQSISRIRAVPPSRNPPPSSNLPPTPRGGPPSPLTFRSPRNLSASSLLNSANSASDDPSILAFDLPPSTPSSEASSVGLCFAPTAQQSSMFSDPVSSPISTIPRSQREIRSTNAGRLYRHDLSKTLRSATPSGGSHTAKSSLSSNHTLMSAFAARGDTPVQRSVRKSMSQSSISAIMNGRGDRQRVDSEMSMASGNLMLEENPVATMHNMRSLRKQRSMHNTRAPGGSLALPPLPQQLRHVSSFNASSVSEASGSGHSSHTKGDSLTSPFGSQRRGVSSSTPASTAASSVVHTPTTPQTLKKRSIFSSHGKDREREKDRRDSNLTHERDKHDFTTNTYSNEAHHADKKKSHSIGLGIFSGHFSPSSSSSQVQDSPPTSQELPRPTSPSVESISIQYPSSPPSNLAPSITAEHLTQHILPPKELLSQMEALADMDPPSSPPQFSDRALGDETEDDYWEGSSIVTTDKHGMRSRLNSLSGHSIASSTDESGAYLRGDARSSTASLTTRHFANPSGSIQGRLQNDRPSTSSRLPVRNASGMSSRSRISNSSTARPVTADSFMRGFSSDGMAGDGYAPTGLPPPPRRKGAVISSPTTDQFETDEPEINPLIPPPARNAPGRLQRLPSSESQNQTLHRLSSYETISTYNPNRGSIFRKPSFLNIEDELNELANNESKGPMATVPEDSFLILEHGKDSLDLGRASDGIQQ